MMVLIKIGDKVKIVEGRDSGRRGTVVRIRKADGHILIRLDVAIVRTVRILERMKRPDVVALLEEATVAQEENR